MKAPEDADARIEVELKRGLLQLAVLSMARERTYGYRLCKSLADGGLEVEEGTLYPVLRRLEGQGFLRSLWETSGSRTPARTGLSIASLRDRPTTTSS